jgi:nucleotide-binding universal stress UspA family protein
MNERPLLIAYDGSAGSRAAIAEAGALFPGRKATILTVWAPVMTTSPLSAGVPIALPNVDEQIEDEAAKTAANGARVAEDAGLRATGESLRGAPAWSAIVNTADDIDAELIVMGARGLSPFKSALLGSVSNGVVHHTTRPVLVVHDKKNHEEKS